MAYEWYPASQTKLNSGFSPSVKQRQNPCPGPKLEYQDLSTCHNEFVKKAIADFPTKMKGNSKRTSGYLLSPLWAKNKDIGTASQTLLTKVKLRL